MRFNNVKMRELREDADMTQEELAEKTGVSRATILQLEKGNSIPRIDFLDKLSQVFGVTGKYFLD